jgi:hypothetical protein
MENFHFRFTYPLCVCVCVCVCGTRKDIFGQHEISKLVLNTKVWLIQSQIYHLPSSMLLKLPKTKTITKCDGRLSSLRALKSIINNLYMPYMYMGNIDSWFYSEIWVMFRFWNMKHYEDGWH